ncbi:hypothetical protein Hanom_Chr07g00673781 [Helianthus anomalus]
MPKPPLPRYSHGASSTPLLLSSELQTGKTATAVASAISPRFNLTTGTLTPSITPPPLP